MIILPKGSQHVMLDLETLDTGANAAIATIGAVHFDAEEVKTRFYVRVNIQSAVDQGGTLGVSTLLWWMQQDYKALLEIHEASHRLTIFKALKQFEEWLPANASIWGNGVDFDNTILGNAYKSLGYKDLPWNFRANKCYRTVRSLYPEVSLPRNGTAHNALDDAMYQAQLLMEINKYADT